VPQLDRERGHYVVLHITNALSFRHERAVDSPLYLPLPEEEGAGQRSSPLKHKTADRAAVADSFRTELLLRLEMEVNLPSVVERLLRSRIRQERKKTRRGAAACFVLLRFF